ncbi:hypothetical protein [Nitrospira sp. M1]
MRQIFNNPWVVIGLCGVAMLILYFNTELSDNTIPSSVPGKSATRRPVNSTVDSTLSKPVSIDVTQLDWPQTLVRDPFAPVTHHTQVQHADGERDGGAERGSVLNRGGSPPPPLLLTAVTLKPEPKLAMINRKLVAEGDDIEGLLVTRIASDGVWLDGPSGSHHLVFDRQERTRSLTNQQREGNRVDDVREERMSRLTGRDT